MHGRNRKDGEKEQCAGNITPAKLVCEWLQWLHIFVGRADFDFFVRFDNTASCINDRHAGSSQLCQLCLLAFVVAVRSARTCFAACAG